jgi:hypothetical protein
MSDSVATKGAYKNKGFEELIFLKQNNITKILSKKLK